jgi:hypothetical protein
MFSVRIKPGGKGGIDDSCDQNPAFSLKKSG